MARSQILDTRAIAMALVFLIAATVLSACARGSAPHTKTVSRADIETGSTFLARRAVELGEPKDGRSGIYLVSDGPESLALRLVLAERAERTIDAQYYLLHDDASGHLFAWQLLQAAERGTRVRLLLDDFDVSGYDAMMVALDRHPNIEIRLFNPFKRGVGKYAAALLEFQRVNRRMHNKSITFDNTVTIVGGRNIGDEYFAAHDENNYRDLDVLGVGEIATQVSSTFDSYWNSPYAVPASAVVRERSQNLSLDDARQRMTQLAAAARDTPYGSALEHSIRTGIISQGFGLRWVPAKLVADPPEKAAGIADADSLVVGTMRPYVLGAEEELVVSSAYFVPNARTVGALSGMAERGVSVSILTNSIASTDVFPVYSHYSTKRKDLLAGGVDLWELRPDGEREDRSRLSLGQSQSSLHMKAFIIDRKYFFVGSFNWDPRSAWTNNEMGVLIRSEELAEDALRRYEQSREVSSYRLRLDADGEIDWLTRREDGAQLLYPREPDRSAWDAFLSSILAALPIENLL